MTDADVRGALARVHDPCSLATDSPISIVDLGLVRHIEVDPTGTVDVVIGTTGPGCLYYPILASAAERAVADLPGVRQARVRLDPSYVWRPDDMAAHARADRDARLVGGGGAKVRPQQWKATGS